MKGCPTPHALGDAVVCGTPEQVFHTIARRETERVARKRDREARCRAARRRRALLQAALPCALAFAMSVSVLHRPDSPIHADMDDGSRPSVELQLVGVEGDGETSIR